MVSRLNNAFCGRPPNIQLNPLHCRKSVGLAPPPPFFFLPLFSKCPSNSAHHEPPSHIVFDHSCSGDHNKY